MSLGSVRVQGPCKFQHFQPQSMYVPYCKIAPYLGQDMAHTTWLTALGSQCLCFTLSQLCMCTMCYMCFPRNFSQAEEREHTFVTGLLNFTNQSQHTYLISFFFLLLLLLHSCRKFQHNYDLWWCEMSTIINSFYCQCSRKKLKNLNMENINEVPQ